VPEIRDGDILDGGCRWSFLEYVWKSGDKKCGGKGNNGKDIGSLNQSLLVTCLHIAMRLTHGKKSLFPRDQRSINIQTCDLPAEGGITYLSLFSVAKCVIGLMEIRRSPRVSGTDETKYHTQ